MPSAQISTAPAINAQDGLPQSSIANIACPQIAVNVIKIRATTFCKRPAPFSGTPDWNRGRG